jgi:hypothetical protein
MTTQWPRCVAYADAAEEEGASLSVFICRLTNVCAYVPVPVPVPMPLPVPSLPVHVPVPVHVPLHVPVPVHTQVRGKLYVWDADKAKDWRERGVGMLKINVPTDGGHPGRLRTSHIQGERERRKDTYIHTHILTYTGCMYV